MPPSGQLEKHGENQRKPKKTKFYIPKGCKQKKTLFPIKRKKKNFL
jgi:hypothetical protein